jgi:hypothetical protein
MMMEWIQLSSFLYDLPLFKKGFPIDLGGCRQHHLGRVLSWENEVSQSGRTL